MDITITGRGVEIPDRFEDYATEKSEKVAHLADKALALEIRVIRHHETGGSTGEDRVELTLIGPGPVVRAEASAIDKYAAFDLAFEKLVERIRQAKDRRKIHRGARRPESIGEATSNGRVAELVPASTALLEAVATGEIPVQVAESEEPEWSPVVIRHKVFPAVRMTQEDAVDHMELVGHDFFLFVDAVTDNPSVVYRRKGWNYGVISLEEQEDEVAKKRRR
ncbi:ribosome hibernation-promoting factor, HPF/YfiA family [Pseudolysinimonas yzui]|uniref:Ribosome hibernation promoting factor n=1 Tax=Pseudolysinimonas yzui TaxID=2708254 RepID=A0A8J3GQT7_9MICO|nr:ribosome-associated translation inhibitor RaiA [Pseudolysinimonas yzui]GHF15761.1 ribosomal subunit interface protein [Pseudolysinimonas yzui]